MPTNPYGPGDNYELNSSHVFPALLCKFQVAEVFGETTVTVWRFGTQLCEFMDCDDLAEGLVFLLKDYVGFGHVNVGSGVEVTIRKLVETVAEAVVYEDEDYEDEEERVFDATRLDGTLCKLMDSGRSVRHGLEYFSQSEGRDGIDNACADFLKTC